MNEFGTRSQETFEASKGLESMEARKLEDATFEPRDYVESNRDYQQSEAIQRSFIAVVDNAAALAQSEGTSVCEIVSAIPIHLSGKEEGGQVPGDGRASPSEGNPTNDGRASPNEGNPTNDGRASPNEGNPTNDGRASPNEGNPINDGRANPHEDNPPPK